MDSAGDRSCGEATAGRHRVHAVHANGQHVFAVLSSNTGSELPKPNCSRHVSILACKFWYFAREYAELCSCRKSRAGTGITICYVERQAAFHHQKLGRQGKKNARGYKRSRRPAKQRKDACSCNAPPCSWFIQRMYMQDVT